MEYLHPDRPKLSNGAPCWTHLPTIMLSILCVKPVSPTSWLLSFMVGDGTSILKKEFDQSKLPTILALWQADPEALLGFMQK